MKIKYIILFISLFIGFVSSLLNAQIKISKENEGSEIAEGILDLRSGKVNIGDSQYGLVIPNATGNSKIQNPQGDQIAEGTVYFDTTNNCMKVYRLTNVWSDCLLNTHGVGNVTAETIGVGSTFPIKKATSAYYTTLVISADGNNVYSVGYNYNYKTGFGRLDGIIPSFTMFFAQPTESVSISLNHGILATQTGLVYTWGANGAVNDSRTGQNLAGSTVLPSLAEPFHINDNILIHGRPIEVSSTNENSYVLTDTGKVFSTGSAGNGLNGNGSATTNLGTLTEIPFFNSLATKPNQISASTQWVAVSNGTNTIYVWGSNTYGQTGAGLTSGSILTPTAVSLPTEIKQVSAGLYAGIALSKDSKRIFVWGLGNVISLNTGNYSTPTEIYLPSPFNSGTDKILHVDAARSDLGGLLVTTTAGVFATGNNYYGRLGTGDNASINSGWKLVENENKHKFLGATIGIASSVFITGEEPIEGVKVYETGLGVGYNYLNNFGAPYGSTIQLKPVELFK